MRLMLTLAIGLPVALGCAGAATGGPMKLCYALTEPNSVTTLVIEGEGESASITVYERAGTTEVAPPQRTPGTRDATAFIYPDGTRLTLTEQTLTWPEKSMMPGLVFTRSTCP